LFGGRLCRFDGRLLLRQLLASFGRDLFGVLLRTALPCQQLAHRLCRATLTCQQVTYLTQQFANYNDDFRNQVISPILNKLDAVLSAPALRNIFGFELCPADVCQIEEAGEACPAVAPGDKFQIVPRFEHALIPAWQSFLAANDIAVAGIEFIEDAQGRPYTYDVNTNTNYNPDAEARDGRRGMQAIAVHLKSLLARQYGPASRLASAA
jgi:hypothetical protein